MVDSQLLLERVQRLHEYLGLLQQVAARGEAAYLADPLLRGAGERYLQLSLEIVFDLGSHIIAERGLETPDTYADILRVLGKADILPAELQAGTAGMAGFRNLLVHDYLRLDPARVFRLLVEKLPVLEAIADVFEQTVAGP